MAKWEVVESKVWVHAVSGRRVSPYGALPWVPGTPESEVANWQMKSQGWTVRNPNTGEVGIGRPAMASQAEAEAFAAKLPPPPRYSMGS